MGEMAGGKAELFQHRVPVLLWVACGPVVSRLPHLGQESDRGDFEGGHLSSLSDPVFQNEGYPPYLSVPWSGAQDNLLLQHQLEQEQKTPETLLRQ